MLRSCFELILVDRPADSRRVDRSKKTTGASQHPHFQAMMLWVLAVGMSVAARVRGADFPFLNDASLPYTETAISKCVQDTPHLVGQPANEVYHDSLACSQENTDDRVILELAPCNPLGQCSRLDAACYALIAPRPAVYSTEYLKDASYVGGISPAWTVEYQWTGAVYHKQCCLLIPDATCQPLACTPSPCFAACAQTPAYAASDPNAVISVAYTCGDDQFEYQAGK
jgi:hypothetical protein